MRTLVICSLSDDNKALIITKEQDGEILMTLRMGDVFWVESHDRRHYLDEMYFVGLTDDGVALWNPPLDIWLEEEWGEGIVKDDWGQNVVELVVVDATRRDMTWKAIEEYCQIHKPECLVPLGVPLNMAGDTNDEWRHGLFERFTPPADEVEAILDSLEWAGKTAKFCEGRRALRRCDSLPSYFHNGVVYTDATILDNRMYGGTFAVVWDFAGRYSDDRGMDQIHHVYVTPEADPYDVAWVLRVGPHAEQLPPWLVRWIPQPVRRTPEQEARIRKQRRKADRDASFAFTALSLGMGNPGELVELIDWKEKIDQLNLAVMRGELRPVEVDHFWS